MQLKIETKGGFDNLEKWMKDVVETDMTSPLNQIAAQGTKSLSVMTPTDTGETANSWKGTVIKRGDVSEVVWTNDAHPESSANVAILIDQGHGTGNGGYVPPRPYIKEAMSPIWDRVDKVVEGLIK